MMIQAYSRNTRHAYQQIIYYLCLEGFAIKLFKVSVPTQPEDSMLVAVAGWSHRTAFRARLSRTLTIQTALVNLHDLRVRGKGWKVG